MLLVSRKTIGYDAINEGYIWAMYSVTCSLIFKATPSTRRINSKKATTQNSMLQHVD